MRHWGACLIYSCSNRLWYWHWECVFRRKHHITLLFSWHNPSAVQCLQRNCDCSNSLFPQSTYPHLHKETLTLNLLHWLFVYSFFNYMQSQVSTATDTVSLCKSMRQCYRGRKVSPVNFILFRAAKLMSLTDCCLLGTNLCQIVWTPLWLSPPTQALP